MEVTPNWKHHSKKLRKPKRNPVAIKQSKSRLKALLKKLHYDQGRSWTMKYLVTMASGRDFVLNSGYDVYETAYEAYEEACLHDDYLVNVEPIDDA